MKIIYLWERKKNNFLELYYSENVRCFLLGPELIYFAFRKAQQGAVKEMVLKEEREGVPAETNLYQ